MITRYTYLNILVCYMDADTHKLTSIGPFTEGVPKTIRIWKKYPIFVTRQAWTPGQTLDKVEYLGASTSASIYLYSITGDNFAWVEQPD